MGLSVPVGVAVMAIGLWEVCNGMAASIVYIYPMAVRDIVLLGLMLPVFSLLAIREADSWMTAGRLLAFNSRLLWWKEIRINLLNRSLAFTSVMIFPTFIMAVIFMGIIKTPGEWAYMLFLFITYFIYFYLLALCILILKIKFRQNLLAAGFVLFISFLPNLLAFMFRRLRIPVISGILNLSYALEEGRFYWSQCAKVCILLLAVLFMIENAGMFLLKKQDIYWK